MPFSQASLDFLAENCLQDSRTWFKEHRAQYDELVLRPMQELVSALTPTMLKIDPQFITEPRVGRTISRIYRDTRFSKGKSIYRSVIWCTFSRTKEMWDGPPSFWVDVRPDGFGCGCGYYHASKDSLNAIRELILADDRSYRAARRAVEKQHVFTMEDERYKRSKYPTQPEDVRAWLDQRNFGLSMSGTDFELLFSDRFAEQIAQNFLSIRPFYDFLMLAESRRPHQLPEEDWAPDPFLGV